MHMTLFAAGCKNADARAGEQRSAHYPNLATDHHPANRSNELTPLHL
jgi:hypothetical protein